MARREAWIERTKYDKLENRIYRAIERDGFQTYISLHNAQYLNRGGFGVVYSARLNHKHGQEVVVKRLDLNWDKCSAWELDFMLRMDHCNLTYLRYYFSEVTQHSLYLHLVMDYGGRDLYNVIRDAFSNNELLPWLNVKVYTFQMLRAVTYLHGKGIAHLDIKSDNMLVDLNTDKLTLCDLGRSKYLNQGETHNPKITTLFYRAPEMCLEQANYTFTVDMWSCGCVLLEMLIGYTAFKGLTSREVYRKQVKLLGELSKKEQNEMKMNRIIVDPHQKPSVRLMQKLSRYNVPLNISALAGQMLQMHPGKRILCIDAFLYCLETWNLDDDTLRMPSGMCLPELYNFKSIETSWLRNPSRMRSLHYSKTPTESSLVPFYA